MTRHNVCTLLRPIKGHLICRAPSMEVRLTAMDRLEGLVVSALPRQNAEGVQIVRIDDFRELRSSNG
eukprot:5089839-Alexandrium_andersonii.AAC.1